MPVITPGVFSALRRDPQEFAAGFCRADFLDALRERRVPAIQVSPEEPRRGSYLSDRFFAHALREVEE